MTKKGKPFWLLLFALVSVGSNLPVAGYASGSAQPEVCYLFFRKFAGRVLGNPQAQDIASKYDASLYQVVSGTPYALKDGTIVEGSLAHGGIQPDYRIDFSDPSVSSLASEASKRLASGATEDDVILLLIEKVRTEVLPDRFSGYHNYLMAMREAAKTDGAVHLNDYAQAGCGFCREHTLLLHAVFQKAGIRTRFAYLRVSVDKKVFDHAVLLREYQGETWVMDSFWKEEFNGRNWNELLAGTDSGRRAPWQTEPQKSPPVQVLRINPYPKLMVPR